MRFLEQFLEMMLAERGIAHNSFIAYQKDIGFGNLLVMLQFGTMPAEMTRRNMERFAQDVMPLLRKASKEQFGEFSFVA